MVTQVTTRRPFGSQEQRTAGILEYGSHVGQEPRALLPVDEAMVERQRQRGDVADLDLLPALLGRVNPGLGAYRAESKDRRLTRVDDRRTSVDAEDADIGDRERATGHLRGLRPSLSRG